MEEQLLKEYVGTYLNPKYNGDWDVINSKFPELSGVDKELLKEYVGTYLNPKYNGDWSVVNSKFPELFPVGKAGVESPMAVQTSQEPPKKKGVMASPFVAGGSEPTKSDGLGALAVQVQDESILTKKPRQERPVVSAESTKVVSQKVPQVEQQPDEIDKKLTQIQEEKKGGKSYLENIALNLGLGASYANEAVASIPESIVNLLAIPQNYIAEKTGLPIGVTAEGIKESWGITNPLLDYVKEDQKILSGEVSKFIADRYEDPSIVGNFEKGNYKEGFELLGSAITQSVPVSIGLMIGGAYTSPGKLATVATLGFTEDQREELAAMDPTMSEAEKTLKAAGMAGAESVFSSIGTATIGRVYRDIAKREGAEAAKGILRNGLIETYKKAIEKTGVVAGFVGEGIEEAATQITQNVISGKPAFEGAADAFVTGAGSGVVFTAPISAINAKKYVDNKVQSYQTKGKVTEILKDKGTDISQVYNVPVSSEITTSQLEISNLPNSRNLLVNNLKKSVSNGQITDADAKQSLFVFDKIQQVSNAVKDLDVSQEDKARVATLLRQRDDLRTKIQNKDDVLVVQEKQQIEDINNQIQEIITKPKEDAIQEQAAGQVPVQPGTGVSQEVAQGEPQAEPQGVTQEGQEKINEIERRRQEELDRYEGRRANSLVKYNRDGENTELTESEIEEAEIIINSAKERGLDVDRTQKLLQANGFVHSLGNSATAFREFLKARLSGEIDNKVNGEFLDAINAKYDAEVAAIQSQEGQVQEEVTPEQVVSPRTPSEFALELQDKYGVELDLLGSPESETLSVSRIVVPKEQRGKGVGAKVMEEIIQFADINNKKLVLTPSKDFGGTSVKRLTDFYKRFGFVENKGKNKDFTIRDTMYRVPDVSVQPVATTQEEVAPQVEFNEEEVNLLSSLLDKSEAEGTNLPEVFQLETTTDNEERKQALVESATKLMETVSDDLSSKSSPTNAPTMEPTPIVITENTELTNKVPRFPLVDLIKKRINLVMADQLKVGDGFMGGPLFPLIDGIFGKAAWASINLDAAKKIVRGAINGDYSVVFNMNPTAVDSNTAFMDTFIKKLNDAGIKENVLVELKSYVKDKKFGKKTDQIRKITEESATIDEFSERLSQLDVDTISDFVKKVIPSKSVVAETAIGKILQSQNITQEDIRDEISEQLAKDLPMGAMTMVLKITDANGNPVTEKNIDDAIITPEQQKAEGIPSHRNYPFYVRGTAVGILDSTVPFWNMSKAAMSTINAKVAKVIRNSEGKAYSASQARAAAMRSASMKASKSFVTQPPTKSAYQQFIERLSKAIPSVEVVTSQKEFDDLLTNLNAKSLATKNQKIYGAVLDGKLYLNPSLENFNTPIHEFAHVWTNTIKELSPEIYKKGIDLIKGSDYVSQIEASKDYKRITDKMRKDGATDQEIRDYILEEALATAVGDKGESFATASQQRNFKNWLNDLFQFIKKLTGISKLTPEQIQDLSLDDFLNSVVVDLLSEKPIFKNAEVRNLNNQLQLMARPDLKADDIVKIGLANGFSEGSIRELLKRRGFTQEEINRAVASTVQAAKKVEVTEEFAPGYDRMITELEGVVEKSLKRGTTQARAMENAINYLQGTKVYENATDVQREQMVRDVNKRFKKRQKSAPTAKRVLGQKKDVVTVTVDLAKERDRIIKEQIKLAKEITGDLNKKRAALAENIKPLIKRGIITANQARTIINRISKVNLNNPIMVDKLVEYIDKVFDNANYAAEMDEIRKLQAQAKSRNHTSMTSLVNEFTSINPEDIPLVDKETGEPLNKIMEYKEALDFLNTRTPFYGKMNEVFDEMVKYKKVEKFDAVKTKDALIDKYKSIMDKYVGKDKNDKDKLKTVEDYVSLIKDLNAFKRKAFQLLQNEAINQKEYEDLINGAGETQAVVDRKFAEQIDKIKRGMIADIKNQRPKPNPNFTKEENDLIKEYLQLSDDDLKNLSPEDLFILNDLLDNISNGEIDYYRLNDIVSRAVGKQEGVAVGKQLKQSKLSLRSEELRKEMAKFESAFWEGLLGLGRATSGPLQKFIISPFNRAIGSYEKFTRDGYNDFLKLKDKYGIKKDQMNKIGMLTTYLQEYMAQFDPKNKGVKDIGKRDWFKEILSNEDMRDDYSPEELKTIEDIYKTLPKDKDGNVDPKAVHDSYEANDGKFFTKKEKDFFDSVMNWKKENSTGKQKAANEMSGNPFKEIPFHMLRSRYGSMSSQITPTTSGDNGMVRINAGTGKERVSEAVGAINTDFEKLFIKGLEQTGRDFFLTKALKDINNVLASAKKELDGDKNSLIKAVSYTLSDALSYEFSDTASQNILKRLVQARAAMTLFDPIRAGVEFTSTLLSFGLRARTLSGYKNLFGSQGDMKNLLEFTDSPLRLRQNISNAIDINDGKIEKQSMLTKWTTFLSGLPERTMMVTSWMPTFTNEFQRITKEKFDMKKFNDSEAYREKYGKAIKEASAVADAQTEKIIGPTTKAGQRREIAIFPGKTVGRDTVSGQILGFFSNYPYREVTEFVNGFKEAGEVLKKGDSVEAISQLQKPLGIALNVAAYGFLSSVVYASRLILLGDDDEEERGSKMLEELMTAKGFIEETAANAAALAASKYAGGGRATLQLLATLAMDFTDDEETKATIKKMLKGSVYVDPLPTQNLTGYGSVDKVNTAILKYIPQLVMLNNVIIDGLGGLKELGAIYDKVESKGVDALTKDEELRVLALSVMFTGTQLLLNWRGSSLPSYNNLKAGMKAVKEEAGVSDIADGKVPAKKSSGGGGGRAKTMNKSDLKRYFPEQYNELYGEGSATYEIEQEVKAFEKEQRELKKKIKDQVYGD